MSASATQGGHNNVRMSYARMLQKITYARAMSFLYY